MSPRRFVRLGLALAGLLGAAGVWAQSDAVDDARVRSAAAPGAPFGQGSVSLLAGNDGSAISLSLDLPQRSEIPKPGTDCAKQACWARFTTYTARFDAPLAKGKKRGTLLTADGLGSDASVTVGFTQSVSKWVDASGAQDSACESLWSELRRRASNAAERAGKAMPAEAARLKAEAAELTELVKSRSCGSDLLKKYPPAKFDGPEMLSFVAPGAWLYGAEASFGVQDVSYIDTTTLKSADQRDEPWGLAFHLGVNPAKNPRSLYLLTVERKRVFEERDEGVACQSPGGVVNCVAGRLGGPAMTYTSVVRLEGRWLVSARYAASLVIARDRTARRTSVDVPLHLVSTKEGALIGGLNVGWRSDTGRASLGVFVGTPFSLFP